MEDGEGEAPARAPLPVLYLDEHIVVVNKPSGLASHRGWARDPEGYVLTRVRDQLGGDHVYLGHRLDRATSGAIVLARRPELQAPLQRAFAERVTTKRYLVGVRGVPEAEGLIDYAIPKSSRRDPVRVDARTRYRRLAEFENRYALLECTLETGRLHQIRRHMRHLRNPVLGDTTYGDNQANKVVRERFGLNRLALHAAALAFPHPVTDDEVSVLAPVPDDLAAPFARMGFSHATDGFT